MSKISTACRGRRHYANKDLYTARLVNGSRLLIVVSSSQSGERYGEPPGDAGVVIGWRSREVTRHSNLPAYR